MRHERAIVLVVTTELRQIVRVILVISEKLEKARDAGVERVSHSMNDCCIREGQMNETDENEIAQ